MKIGVFAFALAAQAVSLTSPGSASDLGSSPHRERSAGHVRVWQQFYQEDDSCRRRSFDTLGFDDDNALDPANGCSLRADVAAQVSRKGDLRHGRGTRFSDGERNANIVRSYRMWKPLPVPDVAKATLPQ